ncbi:MAG: pyruvate kinase, partial [Candidatus Ranarchaeia archaeon]
MVIQPVRSKIVCTIGPATRSVTKIKALVKEGMDVARINMSHGSYEDHETTINIMRKVAPENPIMMDLSGVRIRVGRMRQPIDVQRGETISITTEDIEGTKKLVPILYEKLIDEVEIGGKIFINDGVVELKVEEKRDSTLICKVLSGGIIDTRKGVNTPAAKLSTKVPTEKDIHDIKFGIERNIDFFALSFVRRASDIERAREIIKANKGSQPIIAKIEHPDAVNFFESILNTSDGIMVARGDLGIETSPIEVPLLQKRIIRRCNQAAKPVIVATHMLESMINHPRPTRAEASDVANAILDGTDATMLSGETAIGKYPVEAVKVMNNLNQIVEKELKIDVEALPLELGSIADMIGNLVREAVQKINPQAI